MEIQFQISLKVPLAVDLFGDRMDIYAAYTNRSFWQAYSREPSFDEWIRSDMEYIDKWSLTLDMKILLRTIPAVLLGQGAH